MEWKGDNLIVSVLKVTFCIAVINRWKSILQKLGEKKACWRTYSTGSQPHIIKRRTILLAFLCRKLSSPDTKMPQTSASVMQNGGRLWWNKFCSCVLNLFWVLFSHFPQPSQWYGRHCTRLATGQHLLPKIVLWRQTTVKTQKKKPKEKRDDSKSKHPFGNMWQVYMYIPEGNQIRHKNYADPYMDPLSLLKADNSHLKEPWQTEVIDTLLIQTWCASTISP